MARHPDKIARWSLLGEKALGKFNHIQEPTISYRQQEKWCLQKKKKLSKKLSVP